MQLRRWVISSVAKQLGDAGHKILFGLYKQNNPETDGLNAGEIRRVEFRLVGPETIVRHKRERHFFHLNFLITQSVGNDVYVLDEYLDSLRNDVSKDFCIMEIDDDHTEEPFDIIGTLKVNKSVRRPFYSYNLGLLEPSSSLAQGILQGRFYLDTLVG